jgi:hypothetical protein
VKTAVVTMAQITAEPGMPLSEAFWCGRHDGESWPAWKLRMQAELLERQITWMQYRISIKQEQIRQLADEAAGR